MSSETVLPFHPHIDADLAVELKNQDELIVVKPLKFAGRLYQAGDVISTAELKKSRWYELLIRQGRFTDRERWEATHQAAAERKFQRDVVAPAQAALNTAQTTSAKARQRLAEAEAAARAAREAVEAAEAQERLAAERAQAAAESKP